MNVTVLNLQLQLHDFAKSVQKQSTELQQRVNHLNRYVREKEDEIASSEEVWTTPPIKVLYQVFTLAVGVAEFGARKREGEWFGRGMLAAESRAETCEDSSAGGELQGGQL